MYISDLIRAVESIAPAHLAEEWDNVGLIIGSPEWTLAGPVLLTIDLTEAVAEEAAKKKCAAVIAYHPPIFRPIGRIADGPGASGTQRVALRMARAGIAAYSPHTALDAAAGGVTDWLADGILGGPPGEKIAGGANGADRRAIRPRAKCEPTQELKIVTFVPESSLEKVRQGLASAGAGICGHYTRCSFSSPGTSTFMGGEGSKPAVGKAGRFERVSEVRLEMVCSRRALALAITTLRQFHPYEEPAIDVYALEGRPDRRVGVGRRLLLDHPATLGELADRLKKHIGVKSVQVAPSGGDLGKKVSCVGLVPGAGGSVAMEALADGCEAFVTGEMKHHEVAAATGAGLSVILGGHTATERGYMPTFAKMLRGRMKGVEFMLSAEDRDPLVRR